LPEPRDPGAKLLLKYRLVPKKLADELQMLSTRVPRRPGAEAVHNLSVEIGESGGMLRASAHPRLKHSTELAVCTGAIAFAKQVVRLTLDAVPRGLGYVIGEWFAGLEPRPP